METDFNRMEYESYFEEEKAQKNNARTSGKHLMIFNDKSGSMAGKPFRTLTLAMNNL